MELLLGAGNRRLKGVFMPGREGWTDLVTLDISPACKPDVTWDLNNVPLPFADNQFDEIHAYEVLEHVGKLGDYRFFFAQFEDFWRILKPGGTLHVTTPHPSSPWAWGDPGHTRLIPPESLSFLSQQEYRDQVGRTPMTDYREIYGADLRTVHLQVTPNQTTVFVLQAIKEPAL